MQVIFIDTSIMANILDIPFMNEERSKVMEKLQDMINNSNKYTLILPLATIIETGNHIAHIKDGTIRREKAYKMAELLQKTANNEAPWEWYGRELEDKDLMDIAQKFPNTAMTMKMGIGDLSIIKAYEKYKKNTNSYIKVMIWSLDKHLSENYSIFYNI
ncbi:MAG: hypothetical protein ACI3ZR_10405 [bacterium]